MLIDVLIYFFLFFLLLPYLLSPSRFLSEQGISSSQWRWSVSRHIFLTYQNGWRSATNCRTSGSSCFCPASSYLTKFKHIQIQMLAPSFQLQPIYRHSLRSHCPTQLRQQYIPYQLMRTARSPPKYPYNPLLHWSFMTGYAIPMAVATISAKQPRHQENLVKR